MREFEEIKENRRIYNLKKTIDGGTGTVHIGGWDGSVIFSYGAGWEHVSVSPFAKRILPSWDDMCVLKDMFFKDDEVAIQIHPPKADYVNNKENCLHLWRCTYKEMVLPPSCLVGIKNGQTRAELMAEIKEAYKIAGEEF